MRIGIMGVHYGHIGGMLQSAQAAANGEIVGLVEADDALYERYAAKANITRFNSLEEMLAEAGPELVLEGLVHDKKVDLVEACAKAGVHLLLDKPLCRTLDDWERIQQAVSAHSIELSMWFTSRSHPPFIALRHAILDGELGEIASLISTHPHKMRRDQVDTLQLHEADMHHWWSDDAASSDRILPEHHYAFDEAPALAALRELKASGRCRFIGISGYSADDMSRVLQNTTVDTFLLAFNYDLLRRGARQVLPIAGERGITKLIGAIFQRGLSRPQPELLDDPPNWMTADLVEGYRRVYALQKESGLSLAAIGVRYMLAQPEPDTIIIGAASPAEIEECVQAAEQGALPEDLYQEIEALCD